jgi:AcrR family transcriptional regulator
MTVVIKGKQENMSQSTREKMVSGAADLISRRGVNGTSLRNVVDHTGTPRGSLSHHFPGGKMQMLEEAIAFASDGVAVPLHAAVEGKGVVKGLHAFIAWWRELLVTSDYEAGCVVLAVAVEPLSGAEGAQSDSPAQPEKLRALAHEAFARWEHILADALRREGVGTAQSRPRRLAVLTVAAIEGTVAMCRAARSTSALDDVQHELEALLEARIGARS